jgi:hypothetical protein
MPDEPIDWFAILAGGLPQEDVDKDLARAVKGLAAFAETHPDAEERVLEILARRVDGPLTADTWDVVVESLSSYADEDVANLIAFVGRSHGGELELVKPHANAAAVSLLARAAALYGRELRDAYACWRELPHNWRVVNRDTYLDLITGRPVVKLRIEKYNGEEVLLEGSSNSVLLLVAKILWALRALDSAESFSPAVVEEFLGEVGAVLTLLGVTAAPEDGQEPQGADGDAAAEPAARPDAT